MTLMLGRKVLITRDIPARSKGRGARSQRVNEGRRAVRDRSGTVRFAMQQAKATLDKARTTTIQSGGHIKIYQQMIDLAQQAVDLKQRDVDRKANPGQEQFGSQLDLDNASNAVVTGEKRSSNFSSSRFRIQGPSCSAIPDVPLETISALRASQGGRSTRPERNLDHTRDACSDGWHGNAG